MMKNYDESVKIIHNPNWPSIADNPYIDKIYFHVEDQFELRYESVFNGRKKEGIEILKT